MQKILKSNDNKFLVIYDKTKNRLKESLKDHTPYLRQKIEIDGIIFIDDIKEDLVFFDLFNIDGSRAEVSGNGLACLSLFVFNLTSLKDLRFINSFYRKDVFYSKAINDNILVGFDMSNIQVSLKSYEKCCSLKCYELSLPNPHLVVIVENFDKDKSINLAKDIYNNFDRKLNVHVFDIYKIFMYTFERGVGFTYSCGSGTIACAYVYNNYLSNKINDDLVIYSMGGSLKITVNNQTYWLWTNPSFVDNQKGFFL